MAPQKEKHALSKRRPNFSKDEIDVLVDGVVTNYDNLFGQFSSKLTPERKDELWRSIAVRVNSKFIRDENMTPRGIDEIKKKYQCLKADVKSKAAGNKKAIKETGGGTAELHEMTDMENQILYTIPPVSIYGLSGGFDTSSNDHVLNIGVNDIPIVEDMKSESELPKTARNVQNRSDTKPKRIKPLQSNLHNLQQKQVELISRQVQELKRIGDLIQERNDIEREKLRLKKQKFE